MFSPVLCYSSVSVVQFCYSSIRVVLTIWFLVHFHLCYSACVATKHAYAG